VGSRGSRGSRLPRRKSAATGDKSIGSRFSRTALFLRDASKRLADLSTRHKKEVKQTHYERAYWQNDMHLKLEKFAMMCKNLNEDAAQRSNEVKELTSKLEKVTAERNGLVSQVETLKARVGLYEGETVVQSRIRDNFEKGEAGMLNLFEKAMKGRDETIEDLSKRLTFALQEVENNRLNNSSMNSSMRRQIIFPPSRMMSSQSDSSRDAINAPPSPKIRRSTCSEGEEGHEKNDGTQLSEKALMSLEAAMAQSSDREKAMQRQLDALEQELEEARAILWSTDDHYLEAQLSVKHVSSNSSL
jgi:chromosome segregation ATPase